ncbi:hypothetical protein ACMAZE_03580 [Pseudopelagicola sp. nBUS_20]|uniref:hypothetical protein n=1 Tax=Pseudopelagicola sp. nBUS_20 TaxID=3395317 RepID=UPI003EC01FCA
MFYEKPRFLVAGPPKKISKNVTLVRTAFLIHHQLRINSILRFFNEIYEKAWINYTKNKIDKTAVIVNFNYDYVFVKKVFSNNKIVTIINDDFICQARFNNGNHVKESLKITCQASDQVLAVSHELVDQLSPYGNVELFLPWATSSYRIPNKNIYQRKKLLIWGFIDGRIDEVFLQNIVEAHIEYEFLIVGPICDKFLPFIKKISERNQNISLIGTKSLTKLPLDLILCAIVPYRIETRFGRSVTMLNKGFQLLSVGLPLIVRGMPNFIKSKCIFDVDCVSDFSYALFQVQKNFNNLQSDISHLVNVNSDEQRYREFIDHIKASHVN